jgi:hypothetical protein
MSALVFLHVGRFGRLFRPRRGWVLVSFLHAVVDGTVTRTYNSVRLLYSWSSRMLIRQLAYRSWGILPSGKSYFVEASAFYE